MYSLEFDRRNIYENLFVYNINVLKKNSKLFSRYFLADTAQSQSGPRLEILPIQSVQRKPVGKSLMLTCRPNVPDSSLVTDLQWKDYLNNTVLPKP